AAIREQGVDVVAASSAKKALAALDDGRFDCIVVGNGMRDDSTVGLLKKIAKNERVTNVPIIMYGDNGFTKRDKDNLKKLSESVVLKAAGTPEAVIEETTLFLHQQLQKLSASKRQLLEQRQKMTPELRGKKVLIVDDDIRNIFALTGALEQHGMIAVHAENGK